MKAGTALRQITSLSMQSVSLTKPEAGILQLLSESSRSFENVMTSVDFDDSDTLEAVRHLIENQYVFLVVTDHPWGVEFAVELTKLGRDRLAGILKESPRYVEITSPR